MAKTVPKLPWSCVSVSREDATHDSAFLALSMLDGSPIPFEHGGPRIVLPHLFGWKSCKWLHQVEFLSSHQQGFWEKLGCHMRGRVELNERWAPKTKSIWDFLVGEEMARPSSSEDIPLHACTRLAHADTIPCLAFCLLTHLCEQDTSVLTTAARDCVFLCRPGFFRSITTSFPSRQS